jgi:hypothetical protein
MSDKTRYRSMRVDGVVVNSVVNICRKMLPAIVLMFAFASQSAIAQWENIPGKAREIGAAGDSIFAVWTIGESNAVFKWNEASFAWENYGGKADRIAVHSDGTPWVVNDQQIYRLRGRTWQAMPGKAITIGAGGDEVWAIGTSNAVFRWNERSFAWENYGGKATAIAVDSEGTPWVVNDEKVYRLRGRTWQAMPGKALDIGAGGGTVWCIGESDAVYQWDENAFAWINRGGKASRITVSGDGTPYVIQSGPGGTLIYRLRGRGGM